MTLTSKSELLSAERQQPMTAAEQAEQDGHQAEYARDVPRICICLWQYVRVSHRYVRVVPLLECAWHAGYRLQEGE